MKRPAIRWVTWAVLALGAVVTLGSLLWHAQWNTGLISWLLVAAFALWAVAPYVVLGVINWLSRTIAGALVLLVGSVMIVGGGLAFYYDAFFIHRDPQSALAYLSVPFCQSGAAVLVIGISRIFELKARRSA